MSKSKYTVPVIARAKSSHANRGGARYIAYYIIYLNKFGVPNCSLISPSISSQLKGNTDSPTQGKISDVSGLFTDKIKVR
jgi:hypothetical protein